MRVPLDRYPGMNRFVLDWLSGDERFLPRKTSGSSSPAMPNVDRNDVARALIDSNRRWGLFVRQDVERWASGESVALVAGQQVGFAGGPLYTLAKIASLVKMKRELETQGKKATVFFWLATEDHDFDEVATLNVPVATLPGAKEVNRQLDLVCMRAIRGADGHAVVGSLPVPESLITQLLALFDLARPAWLRQGITFRDSFAELIASIFGKDVVLVDALLPELRRAGAPLFARVVEKWDDVQRALAYRSHELETAGYREQVVAREGEGYTLFFSLDEQGVRQPFTNDTPAERISTSALTRPLLQDFVLQPDVFLGGPAEVAYYAQIAPLHELLGVRLPRVALRGHLLLAPKRVVRAMERYEIAPEKIFSSADAILAEHEPEGVARIRALVAEGKAELMRKIEQIGELALPADHSLAGSIQRSIGHLEFHFNKLSERAIKGLVRKEKERYAATRELVATLFPDRHVQDRVVSWFAWWCREGDQLLERLVEEVEPDTAAFRIVGV